MPASKKMKAGAVIPEWVLDLGDYCLQAIVASAYVARAQAQRHGAMKHRACANAMKSGDATLEQIRTGKIGPDDCDRASAALRAFADARACGEHGGPAKRKRAARSTT